MFGGAFDPPHVAHQALAQAAMDQLRLDELRIFPTGEAWHKTRSLTPSVHRVAMSRLAFEEIPRVIVDDRETLRAGPTFTIDTLRELAAEHPGAELFLLIGGDQAESFRTWRNWQEIAQIATVAVAARPGASEETSHLPGSILIALPPTDVSATAIRALAADGRDISGLVSPPVASYIELNHIYRKTG